MALMHHQQATIRKAPARSAGAWLDPPPPGSKAHHCPGGRPQADGCM